MINLGLSFNMVRCWAAELPLEFPDGTTPVMSRVCIYDSAVGGGVGVGAPLKIALPPQLPLGSLYMEEVHAKEVVSISHLEPLHRMFGQSWAGHVESIKSRWIQW
jgi:hypothetical protein